VVLFGLSAFLACGDGTGPEDRRVTIGIADGNDQLGVASAFLEFPLRVRVVDATRGSTVKDVAVTWSVVAGSGATVTAINAESDDIGVASATLRLGPDTGTYRVEAAATGAVGGPATFSARAILAPVIEAISPAVVAAGASLIIDGRNFSTVVADNTVLFDGWRGRTTAATQSRLTVEVPACVLTRDAEVTVAIGGAYSNTMTVTTTAGAVPELTLTRGSHRTLGATELACIAIPASQAGAEYLIIPQNAVQRVGLPLRIELSTIVGQTGPITVPARLAPSTTSAAVLWEDRIRARERELGGFSPLSGTDAVFARRAVPEIGERRTFKVLTRDQESRSVTAEVRHISQRAILYVDVQAPANGFTPADLQRFGAQFDDPIYPIDTAVFGTPSDIDDNDRVIILFTPAVNALTDRTEQGFIAGYFYGCDLLTAARCADTNSGEIFYGVVPDPAGQFSAPRSKDTVLRNVPGVLAHEFQHMIHFHVRGGTLDVLWLSEALAHAAEDIVGEEYLKRGDAVSASDFRRPNLVRTQFYLRVPSLTTLVAEATPGTLEQRGAAWLFLKYLMGHYGDRTLLGRLTNTTSTGTANVLAATGRPWDTLLAEFAGATWAHESPELDGVQIATRLTFPNFDLRAALATLSGGFPLDPLRIAFGDYQFADEIAAASQDYYILGGASPMPRMHLAYTGVRGGPFAAGAAPQLTILRIR
jgi:hypothetical protein